MWFPVVRQYPAPEFRAYVGMGEALGSRRVFLIAKAGQNLRALNIEEQGGAEQRPNLGGLLNRALREGLLCSRPFGPGSTWDPASKPWVLIYADHCARVLLGKTLMELSWEVAGLRCITEHELRTAQSESSWQTGAVVEETVWTAELGQWLVSGLRYAGEGELEELFSRYLPNVALPDAGKIVPIRPHVRPQPAVRIGGQ